MHPGKEKLSFRVEAALCSLLAAKTADSSSLRFSE
jgi:hypothetical protein